MSEKQAIIVIPVYTTQLTVSEHAALRQCFDILSSYPKCFVKPESLDITSLVRDYPANHIVPFPDTYFKGIAGYNRLMMSPEFYETFAQWEYISSIKPTHGYFPIVYPNGVPKDTTT